MKVSLPEPSNAYCPQTFYTYGTYKEDGTPNFGLFCWLSYCWDGELCVMACIGGEKLTKDRIRATGVFSANLVSEELLPLANYFGNQNGYNPDKMNVQAAISRGKVLNVPVLDLSPWIFELEVKKVVKLDDGDVFICKIRNTLVEDQFARTRIDQGPVPVNEAKPVIGWGGGTYFKVGEMISQDSLAFHPESEPPRDASVKS